MSLEKKKRKMLLKDFQSGYTASQAAERIGAKFGGKGYGVRTCHRWFSKFRTGDLSLEVRPCSGYVMQREKMTLTEMLRKESAKMASKQIKEKRPPKKEVTVESVSFKQTQKKSDTKTQSSYLKNEAVQKLIQRKSEITVTKVVAKKDPAKPSITTKRVPVSKNKNSAPPKTVKKQPSVPQAKKKKQPSNANNPMPKLRPVNGLEADLQLPPHIAKRLNTPSASVESHSIGDGRKSSQKSGETVKKSITVQFQNVSPDLAKNTVRKVPESAATPLNSGKRTTAQQSTALSLPKGVIYLNPQQIFKQNLGYSRTLQRPSPNAPFAKSTRNLVKPSFPVTSPKLVQPSVVVSDSDSEDDLVFPEDVSLPQPKVKAVADTFTTYWDMETDRPILLNPTEDTISSIPPLIEID